MNDLISNKEFYDFHKTPAKQKSNEAYGKSVARKIMAQLRSSTNNYYVARNQRFETNRKFARGFQDMKEFLSFLNIDAKQSFVNLDMKPPAIAPKFMEVLISRFEERQERPTIRGIDKISMSKKKKRRDEAEFRMNMGNVINQLQQESGLQLEDPNAYTPDNYDDLELHFEIEDRLEEEVKFEKLVKDVMDDNAYPVFKRSELVDYAEVGMGIAYVYKDANGNTKFFRCIPEDCFYSYSAFDDFRDATMFGVLKKLKVTEVREMYGNKLSEKQIYEMWSKTYQDGRVDILWTEEFSTMLMRPYDDALIEVLIFEIISNDRRLWVSKTDNYGKVVVDEKAAAPQRLGDNKQLIERDIRVVYKGLYCQKADLMLDWRIMEDMIKPHYALHEVFTNFVISMPNNRDMNNMSVIERGETSIRMMSLIHLKIQQLIAKMRPDGLIIDISGLQNVNLGLGEDEEMTPLELQAIYDQSGNFYHNSQATDEGDEGARREPPIRPAGMDASVAKLNQLITTYNFYLQRLRDDIGTNEYVEGQGVSAKTGLGVLNSQVQSANRATEFIYRAYINLLEGIAKRIAVLEWYNVVQGKYEDSHGMNPMDYMDFAPDLHIDMLPTDDEVAYLKALTDRSITAGAITMEEGFRVNRIAKISVKLAEMYLSKYEAKRRKEAMEDKARDVENNMKSQALSNQQAAQQKMMQISAEFQGKANVQKLMNEGDKIKTFGSFIKDLVIESMKLGKEVPDEFKPIVAQYAQMMVGMTQVESAEAQMDMQAMEQQAMQAAMEQQMQAEGGQLQ